MTVEKSAGTKLAISAGVPATFDNLGYSALAFTTVGEVADFGDIGREYELRTRKPLGVLHTKKGKGGFNDGSSDVKLALDSADAGQVLMKTASNSDAEYAFRVTLPSGNIFYFQSLVMNFKSSIGGQDGDVNASAKLEIVTSDAGVGVVEVLV